MNGFSKEELEQMLDEYHTLCCQHRVDEKGWLTFKDFLMLRTGIDLEKEMKLYKIQERLNDIEYDFVQEKPNE